MCGRYVIISKAKEIEAKFQIKVSIPIEKNYNVSAGHLAPVISSSKPNELQNMHFGFTPEWSKKRTFIINARAEGNQNKENDPLYKGAKGIISKPFFRSSIRYKRCLVIADAFIEGTTIEKLNQPYLVYLKEKKRPIAFAGIYDEWANPESGELFKSFAIITCPSNKLMRRIPHHRMPVIISPSDYKNYLSLSSDLSDITALLRPYDFKEMNAYRIDKQIKKVATNNKEALMPLENPIMKESNFEKKEDITLFGMGECLSRNRKN